MGARLTSTLLVLAVGLPGLLLYLGSYPGLWLDEGYRMNAAYTMAEDGVYGTSTLRGHVPFDPGTSTGPLVIAPVALSYRLFGVSAWTTRAPIVLYTIVALIALTDLSRRLYGPRIGLFVALAVLVVGPLRDVGLVWNGRQLLGEVPGLAFALIALLLSLEFWRRERGSLAVLAGLSGSFALSCKAQYAAVLFVALGTIGLGRWSSGAARAPAAFAPPVAFVAATLGQRALEAYLTPADARAENARMFFEVLSTDVLPGGWGTQLDTTAFCLFAAMLLIAFVRGREALRSFHSGEAHSLPELGIVAGVVAHALWFGLFSIGWPRYAFAGFAFATILAARFTWDVGAAIALRLGISWHGRDRLAVAGVASLALVMNAAPPLLWHTSTGAEEFGAFVRETVPREATLESWDWEIDALSGHRRVHHPHQEYLFLAIRRAFLAPPPEAQRDAFQLGYDPLQADPDYIVSGPFSEWTRIYDRVLNNFRVVAQFGRYRLFERIRDHR